MGGWWGDYSFRCQPVDHSTSGRAMRVSSLLNNSFFLQPPSNSCSCNILY